MGPSDNPVCINPIVANIVIRPRNLRTRASRQINGNNDKISTMQDLNVIHLAVRGEKKVISTLGIESLPPVFIGGGENGYLHVPCMNPFRLLRFLLKTARYS